ncbi:hydroxymethylbilane synthase [Ferruginibacter sp. SUN106]|uniref:hydroxymethylbilane synthase n=1 Tax=Ferruginibacter sp. SUN106 TaxID=2978348 RepID=UPI003D35B378
MGKIIRIGTRESQLAVWQATKVQQLLAQNNFQSELVYIKSEGDIDLQTPLYEMGVQGIFTKSIDIALLNNKIDIAVHSMKDVPTQLAKGIVQAAVLERASYKDILVYKDAALVNDEWAMVNEDPSKFEASLTTHQSPITIATSSIRRKAQWLNRFPNHILENLRGNVNTRLRKVAESNWHGAIFAAAGLERINLRPVNSIELNWMLPAPAQGAIMVVCRQGDDFCLDACGHFNDTNTAICTKIERDFLRILLGGCSTPISALAEVNNDTIIFKGNILSVDGKEKVVIEKNIPIAEADNFGKIAAAYLLANGGQKIADDIRNATK